MLRCCRSAAGTPAGSDPRAGRPDETPYDQYVLTASSSATGQQAPEEPEPRPRVVADLLEVGQYDRFRGVEE